jgi:uncharacterized protein (DUF58 family)
MLTRTGWAFVAMTVVCFVAGIALDYRELIVLGLAFLISLVLAGVWLVLRPRVDIQREVVPARVSEGEGAAGVLTVTNTGRRRCPSIMARESFAGEAIAVPLPSLAAGASHTGSYLLPARRRGYYAVGPLRIAHADPLRLVNLTQAHGADATLWVHPRVHRMAPVPTGRTQDLDGPTNAGAPRGGIAFHSLREYVPGDDLRMIHWRSTARTEKLMVKHTVITNEPRILVLLDTAKDSYDDRSFEDAVGIAASLAVACADRRFPTEVRTTGGITGFIDPTGHGRTDVLDKLAAVQRSADDPGLSAVLQVDVRRDHGVSAAIVTGQPDRDRASAIGRIRTRFQMVTLVQLVERFDRPAMAISGVLGISADTAEDLVRIWKRKVGSA